MPPTKRGPGRPPNPKPPGRPKTILKRTAKLKATKGRAKRLAVSLGIELFNRLERLAKSNKLSNAEQIRQLIQKETDDVGGTTDQAE